MKKLLLTSLLCASALFAESDYNYEITPMAVGTYTEGTMDLERNFASAGLSIGRNLENNMFDQVELGFIRSIEDVNYDGNNNDTGITRIFTNLIKEYEFTGNYSFYSLIGVGYEIFDNEALGNEDSMFGNYGLGIKYKVDTDLAIKADVRHLIETDHGDNNLLYTIGLAFSFGKKAVQEAPVAAAPMEEIVPKDSDNDGVNDNLDKCPNTPAGAKVDKDGCAILVNLNINFDTNSSIIKPQYDQNIIDFANYMKEYPTVKATIEAHTDSRGTDAFNQKLSERRAASAVKELEKENIDASRLNSVGHGEKMPVATNKTKEGMAQNRRVQAAIER